MIKRRSAGRRGWRGLRPGAWLLGAIAAVLGSPWDLPGQMEERPEGLKVTYRLLEAEGGPKSFQTTASNLALFVAEDESPTPFLPRGRFEAEWQGFIWVPIRSDYTFSVERLNGTFELWIEEELALKARKPGDTGDPIRLSRGQNAIAARLTSPEEGDTVLRVLWDNRDIVEAPLPPSQLGRPAPDEEAEMDTLAERGRGLFLAHRCGACHSVDSERSPIPELSMDAPDLTGIGSRLRRGWMADWIRSPQAERDRATMPAIFQGEEAAENAKAVAAFLATQEEDSAPGVSPVGRNDIEGDPDQGREHFQALQCASCHPEPGTSKDAAHQIGLGHVDAKFRPGRLATFLEAPEIHYNWIRMPNFELTPQEAADLAAYLREEAAPVDTTTPPSADETRLAAQGGKLVQTSGCLKCHRLEDVPDQAKAPSLAILAADDWDRGCLAEHPEPHVPAPFFGFDEDERRALQAFAETDRQSLTRHVPSEYAARAIDELNCRACHDRKPELPKLDRVGEKLNPGWMASLIGGQIPYKPRPWLEARMPLFPSRQALLGYGLAAQHGYPPESETPEPADEEMAEIGRQLVGSQGGLGCVTCHSIGSLETTQVPDEAGINLGYTAERLHKGYYKRWMRNPPQFDSNTRMPRFFQDGQSPLFNILDGDAEEQIEAMWHYFRLIDTMPPPKR